MYIESIDTKIVNYNDNNLMIVEIYFKNVTEKFEYKYEIYGDKNFIKIGKNKVTKYEKKTNEILSFSQYYAHHTKEELEYKVDVKGTLLWMNRGHTYRRRLLRYQRGGC